MKTNHQFLTTRTTSFERKIYDSKKYKKWLLSLITIGTLNLTQSVVAQNPMPLGSGLVDSGPNLPIPNPNPTLTFVQPVYIPADDNLGNPFTGTWSSPAASDWIGTFSGTGNNVLTGLNTGTGIYDFSALGGLPIGTYFRGGDLDFGSGTQEIFTFEAFDASGNTITSNWLSVPISVGGSTPPIVASKMPSWSFDNGTYTFDGTSVPGNPNVFFILINLIEIDKLEITRQSDFGGFSLSAPIESNQSVPEGSNLWVLGILAGLGLLSTKRKKPH